ncbi:hypothetical protein GCM10018773_01330 [Streptomyces candidus]|nr:hypothetical protein GCM10018773_01330 [Streptomyces candidus]
METGTEGEVRTVRVAAGRLLLVGGDRAGHRGDGGRCGSERGDGDTQHECTAKTHGLASPVRGRQPDQPDAMTGDTVGRTRGDGDPVRGRNRHSDGPPAPAAATVRDPATHTAADDRATTTYGRTAPEVPPVGRAPRFCTSPPALFKWQP